MQEVRFHLGEDIYNTAKQSGIPEFSTQKVGNTLVYSVSGLPPEVAFRYARPGFEIVLEPVFAFTMYANEQRGRRVKTVTLQLSSTASDAAPFESDAEHRLMQVFVEKIINQFQGGNWRRYADPEWHVMLTGRSSYLDEHGNISPRAKWSMDPHFQIPQEDWPRIVKPGAYWRWVGEGILATLSVEYAASGDARVSPYRIFLRFEILSEKLEHDAKELAKRLKDGDEKGWNSTAKYEGSLREARERNKRLVENAVMRGDSVAPPPEKH